MVQIVVSTIYQENRAGLPGSTVDKNPPANTGATGSIPGLENPIYHGATKPVGHNY